jgi:hypothetical protein
MARGLVKGTRACWVNDYSMSRAAPDLEEICDLVLGRGMRSTRVYL